MISSVSWPLAIAENGSEGLKDLAAHNANSVRRFPKLRGCILAQYLDEMACTITIELQQWQLDAQADHITR